MRQNSCFLFLPLGSPLMPTSSKPDFMVSVQATSRLPLTTYFSIFIYFTIFFTIFFTLNSCHEVLVLVFFLPRLLYYAQVQVIGLLCLLPVASCKPILFFLSLLSWKESKKCTKLLSRVLSCSSNSPGTWQHFINDMCCFTAAHLSHA